MSQTPRPPPGSPPRTWSGNSRACRLRTCPRHRLTPALQGAGPGACPFDPWLSHLRKGLRMGSCPSEGRGEPPWEGACEAPQKQKREETPHLPLGCRQHPSLHKDRTRGTRQRETHGVPGGPRELGSQGPCRCPCERREREHLPTWGRGPQKSTGQQSPGIHES